MFKNLICVLLIFLPAFASIAQNIDGQWQLKITGKDQLEYGTQKLAGGLLMSWQTVIDFEIQQGQFLQGSGKTNLLPEILPFSRPDNMFQCKSIAGVYATRSGRSVEMPRLRYQGFPVAGEVVQNKVRLVPYIEYPGNHYAVMYQCETSDGLGEFWQDSAPRIATELSKRQNAISTFNGQVYSVKVKEVKNLPPGVELTIPLQSGWQIELNREYGARQVEYQLIKLPNE